ncbi:MAG: hypothetical protein CM15mP70_14300 [Pelagibacteraceae bacterium]|nr:MAG: hypothetical protein CM15mP70_14300 [Pelagibacteraceae bacterium]
MMGFWQNHLIHRNTDYRIVLNLEGICRFILKERNLTKWVFIKARLCHDYADDLNTLEPQIDRDSFITKYENFFKMKNLRLIRMYCLKLLTFNYYLPWECCPLIKLINKLNFESPNLLQSYNKQPILDLNTFLSCQ